MNAAAVYDLLVIGAGINGAGIARDAAGRGLKVLLVDRTTSLRDLAVEHQADPRRAALPRVLRVPAGARVAGRARSLPAPGAASRAAARCSCSPTSRTCVPAWMIRAGLFMYDHLSPRVTLPASFGVDLAHSKWGAGLKPGFRKGFVYADARVDDARLCVAVAMSARAHGAEVRTRTRFVTAQARAAASGGRRWPLPTGGTTEVLRQGAGQRHRAVGQGRPRGGRHQEREGERSPRQGQPHHRAARARRGSRLPAAECRQADRVRHPLPGQVFADRHHRCASRGLREAGDLRAGDRLPARRSPTPISPKPLTRADVVSTFSGVRPLYDDGASDPSAITRDYVFKLDTGDAPGGAPVLSIFGGKLTTYRKLGEHALSDLAPYFPAMKPAWTEGETLPGGDLPAGGIVAVGRPKCSASTPACRPSWSAASRAATARWRPRCWVRPRRCPTSARTSATGSPLPRSTT